MAYERAYRLLDSLRLDLQVLSSHDLISLYPDDVHTLDNPLYLTINDNDSYTATISARGATAEFRSINLATLATGSDISIITIQIYTSSHRKLGSTRLTLDLNSSRWATANLTVRPNRYAGSGGTKAKLKVAYRVKSLGNIGNVGSNIRSGITALFDTYNRAVPGTRVRTTCVRRITRIPSAVRRIDSCGCGCDGDSNDNCNRTYRTRIRRACDYRPNCRCDSSESCHICESARARRIRHHDDLLESCLQESYGNSRSYTHTHSRRRRRCENDCDDACCEPSLRISDGSVHVHFC